VFLQESLFALIGPNPCLSPSFAFRFLRLRPRFCALA
jgi:hypothetical protein